MPESRVSMSRSTSLAVQDAAALQQAADDGRVPVAYGV